MVEAEAIRFLTPIRCPAARVFRSDTSSDTTSHHLKEVLSLYVTRIYSTMAITLDSQSFWAPPQTASVRDPASWGRDLSQPSRSSAPLPRQISRTVQEELVRPSAPSSLPSINGVSVSPGTGSDLDDGNESDSSLPPLSVLIAGVQAPHARAMSTGKFQHDALGLVTEG